MGILDDYSAPDENGMAWLKLKSSQGNDFQVGLKYSDLVAAVQASEPAGEKHSSHHKHHTVDDTPIDAGPLPNTAIVNWLVNDPGWITLKGAVRTLGIYQYDLHTYGLGPYHYVLRFSNDGGMSFEFTDATGDTYSCTTIFNMDHEIMYNSSNPTIVKVRNTSQD